MTLKRARLVIACIYLNVRSSSYLSIESNQMSAVARMLSDAPKIHLAVSWVLVLSKKIL